MPFPISSKFTVRARGGPPDRDCTSRARALGVSEQYQRIVDEGADLELTPPSPASKHESTIRASSLRLTRCTALPGDFLDSSVSVTFGAHSWWSRGTGFMRSAGVL